MLEQPPIDIRLAIPHRTRSHTPIDGHLAIDELVAFAIVLGNDSPARIDQQRPIRVDITLMAASVIESLAAVQWPSTPVALRTLSQRRRGVHSHRAATGQIAGQSAGEQ